MGAIERGMGPGGMKPRTMRPWGHEPGGAGKAGRAESQLKEERSMGPGVGQGAWSHGGHGAMGP